MFHHFIDMIRSRTILEMPPDEEIFNKNISFMESITEAIPQSILSTIILRAYGLSTNSTTRASQVFSITTSSLSMLLAFGLVLLWIIISFQKSSTLIKIYALEKWCSETWWRERCYRNFLSSNYCIWLTLCILLFCANNRLYMLSLYCGCVQRIHWYSNHHHGSHDSSIRGCSNWSLC